MTATVRQGIYIAITLALVAGFAAGALVASADWAAVYP